MEEVNKKSNSLFLDKFKGKTSKINKNGLSHALASNHSIIDEQQLKDENAKIRPKKLASLDMRNMSQNYDLIKKDVDSSASINPERKQLLPVLTKRSTDLSIRSGKLDPIAPSPLKQIKQSHQEAFILPPSRSISDQNSTFHRRAFGKYLKLDDDARRHFQFLLEMDHKRNQRKSTVIFSDR